METGQSSAAAHPSLIGPSLLPQARDNLSSALGGKVSLAAGLIAVSSAVGLFAIYGISFDLLVGFRSAWDWTSLAVHLFVLTVCLLTAGVPFILASGRTETYVFYILQAWLGLKLWIFFSVLGQLLEWTYMATSSERRAKTKPYRFALAGLYILLGVTMIWVAHYGRNIFLSIIERRKEGLTGWERPLPREYQPVETG